MAGYKIKVSGINIKPDGTIVSGTKKRGMSVSDQIRQKKSKRVRVVPRGTIAERK